MRMVRQTPLSDLTLEFGLALELPAVRAFRHSKARGGCPLQIAPARAAQLPPVDADGRWMCYTDGACSRNQWPDLAAAGIGVWFASNHPYNVSQPVEGPLHSNQRAELEAFVCALSIAHAAGAGINVATDSTTVVAAATAVRPPQPHADHADLHMRIWSLRQALGDGLLVRKVQAHQDAKSDQGSLERQRDRLGNAAADALACRGAACCAPPTDAVAAFDLQAAFALRQRSMLIDIALLKNHLAQVGSTRPPELQCAGLLRPQAEAAKSRLLTFLASTAGASAPGGGHPARGDKRPRSPPLEAPCAGSSSNNELAAQLPKRRFTANVPAKRERDASVVTDPVEPPPKKPRARPPEPLATRALEEPDGAPGLSEPSR